MVDPMQIEYGQARGVLFSPTFLPVTVKLFEHVDMPLGAAHAAHPRHAQFIKCLMDTDCDNLEIIAQGCRDVSVFRYVVRALREGLSDKRLPKPCYIIQDLLGEEMDFPKRYLIPGCVITDAQVDKSGALSFGFKVDANLVNANSASPFVISPGRNIDVLLTSVTYRQDGIACCKCVPFFAGSIQRMQEDMLQYAANTIILKQHFNDIHKLLQIEADINSGSKVPVVHVLSPRSRDHARFVVSVLENLDHMIREMQKFVEPSPPAESIKDGLLKCINIYYGRDIIKIVGLDDSLESGYLATCCVVKSVQNEGVICSLGRNDSVALARKHLPQVGVEINFPGHGSPLSLLIHEESTGRYATLGGIGGFNLSRQFNIQQSIVQLPDCFFDNSHIFQVYLSKFWPSIILKCDEADSADSSFKGLLSGLCSEVEEALRRVPELRYDSRCIDPSLGDIQRRVHGLSVDVEFVYQINEGCGGDHGKVLVELCGCKGNIDAVSVMLDEFSAADIMGFPKEGLEFIQNQDRADEGSLKTRIETESGAWIDIQLDNERMIIRGEPDKIRRARSLVHERVLVEQLDMRNVDPWFPAVIIGTKGERIRELQAQTETYMKILKNSDVPCSIQIVGSAQHVKQAKEELPYRCLSQDICTIMAPVLRAQQGRLEKQTKAKIRIGEDSLVEIFGYQKKHVTEAYDAILSLYEEQKRNVDSEGVRIQTSPSRARSRSKSIPRSASKGDQPQPGSNTIASQRCPTPPPPSRSIPPPPPSSRCIPPPPPPPSSRSTQEVTPSWRRQNTSCESSSRAKGWNSHVPTKWDSDACETWKSKKPKRDEWSTSWKDDEWRRASWESDHYSWNSKRSQSFDGSSTQSGEEASESKVRGAESNPPLQSHATSCNAASAKACSWGSKNGADNFPCIYLLDGKNIMLAHCSQEKPAKRPQFNFKKLYLALDYYRARGHSVRIFLTELQKNEKASFYQELKHRGLTQDIVVTCPRDKDDNIMFTHAKELQEEHGRHRVYIITKDKFKDWIGRGQVEEDWVSDHCIEYTFTFSGEEPSRFLPERSAGDPRDKSSSACRYQNM